MLAIASSTSRLGLVQSQRIYARSLARAISSSTYSDVSDDSDQMLAEVAKRKRTAEWKRRQRGNFLDHVIVQARAGRGGDGCVAFHREKFQPFGPPSGGNGGRGGDVYILPTANLTSLSSVAKRARAGAGHHGQGAWQHGKKGEDLIIRVPLGTVVRELTDGRRPKDALEEEEEALKGLSEDEAENRRMDKRWVHYPHHQESNLERDDFRAAQSHLAREERAHRRAEVAAAREPMYLDLARLEPDAEDQARFARPIDPDKGYLVASGGRGGHGNPYFLTSTNRSPKYATRGDHGERVALELELKLLADVGLVGLPNAGKSTLLRALTDSKAEVAPYAFTTLNPQVGIVRVWDDGSFACETKGPVLDSEPNLPAERRLKSVHGLHTERFRFSIADNPGLIARASENVGLGHSFLRSIERSLVLVYVLDLTSSEPWSDLRILRDELEAYQPGLSSRAQLVIANKADLVPGTNTEEELEARAKLARLQDAVTDLSWEDGGQTGPMEVIPISGKYRMNLERVVARMTRCVQIARARNDDVL